ncbi:GAF domain-containing protein [Ktedonosporobacter rubrisoli]|uniref:GAF domain-containing protein n=1 Tax=Ktedonosporobacter rubrisoli TaxID=2509675 RepID=A0A4P6K5C0_KTERU|nr:GAF domain-containing protein [Ktedonosporobacter rubrisoli]QBD82736.1 GAF domain-containing protein [Ktedonosporobacter rubrisoli]
MSSKAGINHQLPLRAAEMGKQLTPEQLVEQLQEENRQLHSELKARQEEKTLLQDIISVINSTLRLDEALHHLVDILVRATPCEATFIYLYQKESQRLLLTSANNRYRQLEGKISVALGEGVVGWSALHGKPLLLQEEATEDPRFSYFPELEEEKFQSVLTVPVLTSNRQLIGVITLRASSSYEFTEEHQAFVNYAAILLAKVIENAQLSDDLQFKQRLLASLLDSSQLINTAHQLDDTLHSLAALIVQTMDVDLCAILLAEPARERRAESFPQLQRLTVHTTAPDLNGRINFSPVDVDNCVLEHLQDLNKTCLHRHSTQEASKLAHDDRENMLQRLDPLKGGQYKTLISAPLIVGIEQFGLINCYSSKAHKFAPEDQALLSTIANQAAVAIKNSNLARQLAQKDLMKDIFDDLLYSSSTAEDVLQQRARFLGLDLSKPHAVAIVECAIANEDDGEKASADKLALRDERAQMLAARNAPSGREEPTSTTEIPLQSAYARTTNIIRRRIQDSFPGSVFYGADNSLTGIIALGKESNSTRLKAWLREQAHQIYHEYHMLLSVGLGNICQDIRDYHRSFAEAHEALQMGQEAQGNRRGLQSRPTVTHFNDLGVYRYLYKIAHMDNLRDIYQEQIARIDNYDKRKNTDLLATLDTYLECAGNLTRTSDRLFVHRNTLIQRLERLQSLCDLDLQERGNWLTLQIAIKVYRLKINNAEMP